MSYATVMMPSWWNPSPPDWVSFHVNYQQQNNRGNNPYAQNLGRIHYSVDKNVMACVNNDINKSSNTGNHDDEDEKAKITNMDLEELMSYVLNHDDDSKIEELIELDQERGNDIYLIRRKDAIKMTKLASLHSKASRDAYRKGDHISAQELSLKAQVERVAGEILHAKAAKEILSIKNRNNDMWKLDLHGLHAIEAVQALGEHLQRIEREVSASHRQRRRSLLVITGRGSHSRGQPVLPAAIKSFLSKNRYDYEDSRPGVIKVQPKFSLFAADHIQGWNCFSPMPLHAYVM